MSHLHSYRNPEELDRYINTLSRLPFPVIDRILDVHGVVRRGQGPKYAYYKKAPQLSEEERLRILEKTSI